MSTTYLILRYAFNEQNTGQKSTFVQDSAFLIREEQNSQGKAVDTGQTYEKQGRFLAERGRCCTRQKGAWDQGVSGFSGGMNPCPEPAPLLLGVCTHQEAGGIIQEATKAAHKAPLQEGEVFWRQLLWLVDGSRRAKTLPRCGREGLREDQARIHPSLVGGPQHWALQQFAEHSNRNWGEAITFG